jgi:hypothetical protein
MLRPLHHGSLLWFFDVVMVCASHDSVIIASVTILVDLASSLASTLSTSDVLVWFLGFLYMWNREIMPGFCCSSNINILGLTLAITSCCVDRNTSFTLLNEP